jgi:hypothetical protein
MSTTPITAITVTKASEVFRESVAANFELEADFLNTITELFVKAATPLVDVNATATASASTKKTTRNAQQTEAKPRTPRKKSAYNVYVREQMKTADIQGVDHKQKMGAIAARWNALTEEQKKVYTDMASNENATASA